MKEQRKLIRWIRDHKKALIIAGISIGTLIAIVLGIKNREAIKGLWASLRKAVEKPAIHVAKVPPVETARPSVEDVVTVVAQHREAIPFDVSKHIRNLPDGRHASADKIATALENGFVLAKGQTWVKDYAKGVAA